MQHERPADEDQPPHGLALGDGHRAPPRVLLDAGQRLRPRQRVRQPRRQRHQLDHHPRREEQAGQRQGRKRQQRPVQIVGPRADAVGILDIEHEPPAGRVEREARAAQAAAQVPHDADPRQGDHRQQARGIEERDVRRPVRRPERQHGPGDQQREAADEHGAEHAQRPRRGHGPPVGDGARGPGLDRRRHEGEGTRSPGGLTLHDTGGTRLPPCAPPWCRVWP